MAVDGKERFCLGGRGGGDWRVRASGVAIAFVDRTSERPVVIAADGSCLWCLLGTRLTALTGSDPVFTASGQAVTVAGNGLWSASLTGRRRPSRRHGAGERRGLVLARACRARAGRLGLGRATWTREASPCGTRAFPLVLAGRREPRARP